MRFNLFFVIIFTFSRIDRIFSNQCTNENEEKHMASGIFVCKNSFYVPVACSLDDGTRIPIGEKYTKPNYYYVFECKLGSHPNSILFTPIACQQQGNIIQPGDSYVLQSFWYTCTRINQSLVLQASGCMSETGEKIQANNTYKTKDFSFNCFIKPDGSIYAQPQACIVDGKEYQPDMDVDSNSKSCWYRCQREAEGLRLQVMGCLEGSKKYPVGENMIFGDYVYKCIRNADESVTREPVGCIERGNNESSSSSASSTIEHKFGEKWTETAPSGNSPNLKYIYECKGDSKSVSKSPVQCLYDGDDGQGQLDGGCMRRFGQTVVQCYRAENSVHGLVINDAQADFEQRSQMGLKLC